MARMRSGGHAFDAINLIDDDDSPRPEQPIENPKVPTKPDPVSATPLDSKRASKKDVSLLTLVIENYLQADEPLLLRGETLEKEKKEYPGHLVVVGDGKTCKIYDDLSNETYDHPTTWVRARGLDPRKQRTGWRSIWVKRTNKRLEHVKELYMIAKDPDYVTVADVRKQRKKKLAAERHDAEPTYEDFGAATDSPTADEPEQPSQKKQKTEPTFAEPAAPGLVALANASERQALSADVNDLVIDPASTDEPEEQDDSVFLKDFEHPEMWRARGVDLIRALKGQQLLTFPIAVSFRTSRASRPPLLDLMLHERERFGGLAELWGQLHDTCLTPFEVMQYRDVTRGLELTRVPVRSDDGTKLAMQSTQQTGLIKHFGVHLISEDTAAFAGVCQFLRSGSAKPKSLSDSNPAAPAVLRRADAVLVDGERWSNGWILSFFVDELTHDADLYACLHQLRLTVLFQRSVVFLEPDDSGKVIDAIPLRPGAAKVLATVSAFADVRVDLPDPKGVGMERTLAEMLRRSDYKVELAEPLTDTDVRREPPSERKHSHPSLVVVRGADESGVEWGRQFAPGNQLEWDAKLPLESLESQLKEIYKVYLRSFNLGECLVPPHVANVIDHVLHSDALNMLPDI